MTPVVRVATSADLPLLEDMLGEFYAHEGMAFDRGAALAAIRSLLAHEERGGVWIVQRGEDTAGYLVLTVGFSIEFHGRDAFVDELFVRPAFRGRGLGKAALAFAEAECRRRGIGALHLEVERKNETAQGLYRAQGFVDHDRYLMTKRLGERE